MCRYTCITKQSERVDIMKYEKTEIELNWIELSWVKLGWAEKKKLMNERTNERKEVKKKKHNIFRTKIRKKK